MLSKNRIHLSIVVVLSALGALLLAAAACGGSGDDDTPAPVTRTIFMEAVEPKGTTNIEKEAFPVDALPDGGGYKLVEPNDNGDWTVSTYVWNPGQVVVYEGDTVNLEIVGINGQSHTATIEGHTDQFVVERGKITSLTFVAGAPGVYKISCESHQPAMTGELIVLARS